jgi:hypothetical protein
MLVPRALKALSGLAQADDRGTQRLVGISSVLTHSFAEELVDRLQGFGGRFVLTSGVGRSLKVLLKHLWVVQYLEKLGLPDTGCGKKSVPI